MAERNGNVFDHIQLEPGLYDGETSMDEMYGLSGGDLDQGGRFQGG